MIMQHWLMTWMVKNILVFIASIGFHYWVRCFNYTNKLFANRFVLIGSVFFFFRQAESEHDTDSVSSHFVPLIHACAAIYLIFSNKCFKCL